MDRTYRNRYQILFLTIVSSLLLVASAFGQGETTPIERSGLVGVRLPAGAQLVGEDHVPTQISQLIEKIVAEGGGKLRQGDTEVLLWTGGELKKNGGKAIAGRFTETLKTDGWLYEVGGTENGITVFSLLKDGAARRAVVGFYGEADGTLIFALTELLPNNGGQQTGSNTATDIPGGSVADYNFTTPSGWSRSDPAGKIVLSKDGDKSIAFLPPMVSSGDLETDASRLIWQVYKGQGPWHGNGFSPDYGIFEKGKTAQGLEYFRVYRYAKKASDNEPFPDSRFDAVLVLVKLGDKVAVIAGRGPFQSDYARDSAGSAIDLILYDLTFKSAANSYNVKTDLLGSWAAASTTVAVAYTFNANGTFNKGAVHEFRTSRDAKTDNLTNTSYGMTDTYSTAGNLLTQNYKWTGQVMKYKVRVYQTKYDKDAWQQKVGFLSATDPSGGTMVMTKSR